MGASKSKASKDKPRMVTKAKKEQTKHVRLLVLHKNSQQPQPGTDNFCDALNTYPPPGSIKVAPSNVKILQIPDAGHFSESMKNEIRPWISEWLNQDRVVLVCKLTDCDLQSLKRGTNFENDNRIIVFRFTNPPVNFPICICVDVDFYTATEGDMKEKLDELAATIMAGGN
ncbi:Hypothetical predicted protein [Paramuricea clavata]|nr:Hypothetical predicted protein [Paramuricea clavata]